MIFNQLQRIETFFLQNVIRLYYLRETISKKIMITAAQKSAILTIVSNRRKHDKGSIAYMIGMMDANSFMSIYWDSISREKLMTRFTELLDEKSDRISRIPAFAHIFNS